MKKILSLGLLSLLLLVGCNKNIEDKLVKNSYNYKNKVRYTLPTEGFNDVEEFLVSINLDEYDCWWGDIIIDYSNYYSSYNDIYFFKYDGMNVIMRSLNDYVCLEDKSDKVKEEDYFDIKTNDSIFEVIDKLGLPHIIGGSGFISIRYEENYDEYILLLILDFNIHKQNNKQTNNVYSVIVTKEWSE